MKRQGLRNIYSYPHLALLLMEVEIVHCRSGMRRKKASMDGFETLSALANTSDSIFSKAIASSINAYQKMHSPRGRECITSLHPSSDSLSSAESLSLSPHSPQSTVALGERNLIDIILTRVSACLSLDLNPNEETEIADPSSLPEVEVVPVHRSEEAPGDPTDFEWPLTNLPEPIPLTASFPLFADGSISINLREDESDSLLEESRWTAHTSPSSPSSSPFPPRTLRTLIPTSPHTVSAVRRSPLVKSVRFTLDASTEDAVGSASAAARPTSRSTRCDESSTGMKHRLKSPTPPHLSERPDSRSFRQQRVKQLSDMDVQRTNLEIERMWLEEEYSCLLMSHQRAASERVCIYGASVCVFVTATLINTCRQR